LRLPEYSLKSAHARPHARLLVHTIIVKLEHGYKNFSLKSLCKLEAYSIRGNLLSWLSNFLLNRFQRVAINGCLSDWTNVQSGVPQGSVLGPLLFMLYVNDIPDLIEGGVRIFADDTKISDIRNLDNCLRLQQNLNELSQWSIVWLLRFNAAKCKVM